MVKYQPNNPGDNGSIVYIMSPEEYSYRIRNSDFCYVGAEGNRIRGFLMCVDNDLLDKMISLGQFHHEGILPFLSQQYRPFIYGETIAVDPLVARTGLGNLMIKYLFEDMKQRKIFDMHVLIRHSPHRNNTSINFCTDLGFKFTEEEINNPGDNFVWGIYSLKGAR